MKKRIYGGIPFLCSAAAYAESSENGGSLTFPIILVIIVALVVAFIVLSVLKGQMKTARHERMAMNYVRDGSFNLDVRQDIFLYQTETRQKVVTNKNQ